MSDQEKDKSELIESVSKGSEIDRILKINYQHGLEVRGNYLVDAIEIEGIIDDVLAIHFFKNNDAQYVDFQGFILKELQFGAKIKILVSLLNSKYPNLLNKHTSLANELEKIRDFRNRLAHSQLDTTVEYIEKKQTDRIQLMFYKDGKRQYQEITKADFDKKLQEVSSVKISLMEIWKNLSESH